MSIRIIIIDDEEKAISILENKIKRLFPEFKIIATNQDSEEGLEQIKSLKPDLVFLDIAMPVLSGFDILERIKKPSFEVIFITAFDEYAIQAINKCAIGYILKPINNDALTEAINNAKLRIEQKNASERNTTLIQNLKNSDYNSTKIVIPTSGGVEFVLLKDIVRCEGYGGYTKIFFSNKKHIVSSYNLGYYKALLDTDDFFLVHKSHLVNLNFVERYLHEGYVETPGEDRIPVSRSNKTTLLEVLKAR